MNAETDGVICDGRRRAATAKADFRGFSCRWQDTPSHRGETLSLIVEGTPTQDSATSLQEIMTQIHSRLEDSGGAHPLSDRAIMTCLIHLNQKNAVHFVDAAEGATRWQRG